MKSSIRTGQQQIRPPQTAHSLNLQNFRLGNKYLIFDLIGLGKHSGVYYGIDEVTKQERAFKFYNLKEIQNLYNFKQKQICKRLSNYQYQIMKKCKSINILKCYDIFQDRNYKIMVYEYCQTTLQDEIDKREDKQVTEIRAILILKQILNALKNLHIHAEILHTNLQAKNIFIKNGVYKLSDFGLPNIIGEQQDLSLTYAPQIIKRKSYDQRAQTWSIGLLFHQILYGELPSAIIKQNKSMLLSNGNISIYQRQKYESTKEVGQFLSNCLNIDFQERMFLSELEHHQMFRLVQTTIPKKVSNLKINSPTERQNMQINSKQDSASNKMSTILNISQNQNNQIQKELNEGLLAKFYSHSFNRDVIRKSIEKEIENRYQKYGENFSIQQLERTSIDNLKKEINKKQQQCYFQTKKMYLECLKVEFIFEEIILPFIHFIHCQHQKDRHLVQLVYLMLTTCYTTMSKLSFQQNKKQGRSNYENLMQNCLIRATSSLYQKVSQCQRQYSKILQEIQNKVSSMVFDRFKKILQAKKLQEKDRFLNGLQTLDFKKEQKIHFTTIFGNKMVQKLEQQKSVQTALKYFKQYEEIWQIQLSNRIDQKYPTLKSYIDNHRQKKQASKIQCSKIIQPLDQCD